MKRWILMLPALLLLSACTPVAREPDELALVRVLGVDGGDRVKLTAVCGKDAQNGVLFGNAEGDSFERAREAVVWSGNGKEFSLTGVSYLVIGAEVELEKVLFAILEDAELGASAKVWLAEDEAGELLEDCEDPAADLKLLEQKGVEAPSVAQAAAALSTNGSIELPRLEEKNGRLEEGGWTVWRKAG